MTLIQVGDLFKVIQNHDPNVCSFPIFSHPGSSKCFVRFPAITSPPAFSEDGPQAVPPGALGRPHAAAAVAGLQGPLAALGGLRAAGGDLAGKWYRKCGNRDLTIEETGIHQME